MHLFIIAKDKIATGRYYNKYIIYRFFFIYYKGFSYIRKLKKGLIYSLTI